MSLSSPTRSAGWLVLMAWLVGCGGPPAGRHRLDLASADPAAGIAGLADAYFIRLVEERTGGRLRITGHFGGALGYESRDHFEAVETGALELASTPLDKLVGFAPIFQLQSLPFLTPGHPEARALYEVARPHYEAAFGRVGQTLLYASPWTPIGIWAKRHLTKAADLGGLRIRTFDTNGTSTLRAAGAAPVQLAWSDVVPALSTNMIDAVLTSDESGVTGSLWEYLDYFHQLNYTVGVSAVHMNRRVLEALPDDLRLAVRDAAAEAERTAWERSAVRARGNREALRAHGTVVVDRVPDALLAHFERAGAPMLEAWRKGMGRRVAEQILTEYVARLER